MLSAGALLALVATSAQAQVTAPVTLHITGSTAYRAAMTEAIVQIFGGSVNAAYYPSTKTLATAGQAVFQGTLNGQTVTIETDWTGSISGINTVATGAVPAPATADTGTGANHGTSPWLSPSNLNGTTATAGTQTITNGDLSNAQFYSNFDLNAGPGGGLGLAANSTAVYDAPVTADCCMSDSFQSSTPLNTASGTTQLDGITGTSVSANALSSSNHGFSNKPGTGEVVGVIPFVWVKCAAESTDTDYQTWTRLTNITNLQAKYLLGNGYGTANLLTGSSADANVYVNLTGRDTDSGTRFSELAETTYGVTSTANQYTLHISGTAGSPAHSSDSTTSPLLQSSKLQIPLLANNVGGYNSGGGLCSALCAPGIDADFGGYVIAEAGISDADSLLAPDGLPVANNSSYPANYQPGVALSYNGVNPNGGNLLTLIKNGTYQAWEYEHFYTLPYGTNTESTSALTVMSNLVAELENTNVVRPGAPYSSGNANEVTAHVAGYLKSEIAPTVKTSEGGVITP